MFGHDDKHHHQDDEGQNHSDQMAPDMSDDQQGFQGGHPQDSQQYHGGGPGGSDGQDHNHGDGPSDDGAWQQHGEPLEHQSQGDHGDGPDDKPEPISDIVPGRQDEAAPTMPVPPHDLTPDDGDGDEGKLPHELIDIKQKALGQLKPLMSQLDQAPEERFRVLMMMIQASDDQNLIKQAFDAANSIDDEKLKAQALVDLVNEINYFTQHPAAEA